MWPVTTCDFPVIEDQESEPVGIGARSIRRQEDARSPVPETCQELGHSQALHAKCGYRKRLVSQAQAPWCKLPRLDLNQE